MAVTATDDLGQTGSAASTITVTGGTVASFTFAPTDPHQAETVFFDGSASTGGSGASIVEWTWDFGDGSTTTNSVPAASHAFPVTVVRTYVMRLTVLDNAGRTGTTTQNVAVQAP